MKRYAAHPIWLSISCLLPLACGGGDTPAEEGSGGQGPGATEDVFRQFGSSESDTASTIRASAESEVVVAGSVRDALPGQPYAGGLSDAFVRKYDASLTELWTHQFGTPAEDVIASVALDTNDDVIVAGSATRPLSGEGTSDRAAAFVRKYDGGGAELWTREFGTPQGTLAQGVSVDGSGDIIVVGATSGALPEQSAAGFGDAFVRKYDAEGAERWTRQFGTSVGDTLRAVSTDAGGNIFVAGHTDGALPDQQAIGQANVFVRKYDAGGTELWTRQFGTSGNTLPTAIAATLTGGVVVVGYLDRALPEQTRSGSLDAFVRMYDASGTELWTRQFGSDDRSDAYSVCVDGDERVIVAGIVRGALPGQEQVGLVDAFVRSYDLEGNELGTRQFGTEGDDIAWSVSADAVGTVFVAGTVGRTLPGQEASGDADAFVARLAEEE